MLGNMCVWATDYGMLVKLRHLAVEWPRCLYFFTDVYGNQWSHLPFTDGGALGSHTVSGWTCWNRAAINVIHIWICMPISLRNNNKQNQHDQCYPYEYACRYLCGINKQQFGLIHSWGYRDRFPCIKVWFPEKLHPKIKLKRGKINC